MEQSEQHGPVPGQPIPVSPDFPIVWEKPNDEQLFWTHDAMHFPDPLTILDDDVLIHTLEREPSSKHPGTCRRILRDAHPPPRAQHQHLPLPCFCPGYSIAARDGGHRGTQPRET